MKVGIKLRVPLPRMYVFTDSEGVKNAVTALRQVISAQANVKEMLVLPLIEARTISKTEVKPVYSMIGPAFRSEAPQVVEALKAVDAQQLKHELESKGFVTLRAPSGSEYTVSKDMVKFEETVKEGFVAEALEDAIVALEVKLGAAEVIEGLARDIVRRVQFMRKMLKLPVDAFIDLAIYAPSEVVRAVEEKADYIVREVRATNLRILENAEAVRGELVQDWDLDGFAVRIGISRALNVKLK